MRNTIVIVLFLAAVLGGCGGEGTPSTPSAAKQNTSAPEIDVVSVAHEEQPRVVQANVLVNAVPRSLRISAAPSTSGATGLVAELRDEVGTVLSRVEVSWDPVAFSQLHIVESAGSDALTVSWRRDGSRIFETYEIDANELTLEYPVLRPIVRNRIADAYKRGESFANSDAATQEYVAALAAFDEFYLPYASNALQSNIDGDALVMLLTDQFTEVLAPAGYQAAVSDKIQNFCTVVTLCSFVKCFLVPNFLCVPCTGASAACGLFFLACWILDC